MHERVNPGIDPLQSHVFVVICQSVGKHTSAPRIRPTHSMDMLFVVTVIYEFGERALRDCVGLIVSHRSKTGHDVDYLFWRDGESNTKTWVHCLRKSSQIDNMPIMRERGQWRKGPNVVAKLAVVVVLKEKHSVF